MDKTVHKGSCHCGAVAFTFKAPANAPVTHCNCSVCQMTGFLHVFVDEADLTFISGETHLAQYRFGTGRAVHMFCKTCGIKPLYRPRSHPESWSVNLRCVISGTLIPAETIDFNGQNWEASIAGLREKT
ncbi:GFA family protein [Robiginitomaculum antarcticum]|uniref:GFA family protein n=1 Tax=Robiginitomaculum antarcticum TaxID=437507 RepID=UPI0004770EB9|nr:GFA family protein [Robiginitomaculum antarcticum]